jgi:hypothetical protein
MPSANGAGFGVGMGSSGRLDTDPGYYSNNLKSFKHGARQLVGIVDVCICEVCYFGRNDLGGEVIWLPRAKRSGRDGQGWGGGWGSPGRRAPRASQFR